MDLAGCGGISNDFFYSYFSSLSRESEVAMMVNRYATVPGHPALKK